MEKYNVGTGKRIKNREEAILSYRAKGMLNTLSAWETSECAETGVVTIRMTANLLMAILFNK